MKNYSLNECFSIKASVAFLKKYLIALIYKEAYAII